MTKLEQFKAVLKIIGLTGSEFAARLGLSYPSYRTMTAESTKAVPKWVNAFLMGYKMAHDESMMCIDCQIRDNGHGIGFMFCEECIKPK